MKAFENQAKTIEDQGKQQVDALKDLELEGQTKLTEGVFPKHRESDEIKINCVKLQDMKIRLIDIICFMNRARRYMILKYLNELDLFVVLFNCKTQR